LLPSYMLGLWLKNEKGSYPRKELLLGFITIWTLRTVGYTSPVWRNCPRIPDWVFNKLLHNGNEYWNRKKYHIKLCSYWTFSSTSWCIDECAKVFLVKQWNTERVEHNGNVILSFSLKSIMSLTVVLIKGHVSNCKYNVSDYNR